MESVLVVTGAHEIHNDDEESANQLDGHPTVQEEDEII